MSVLRFRAWDGNRYWQVAKLANAPLANVSELTDGKISSRHERHTDELVIEQSTGLHDKNGREVFEGDILGYYFEGEPDMTILGPVKWRQEVCLMAVDIGLALTTVHPEDLWAYLEGESSYRVIGNIHENPELLKGTK